MRLNFKHWIQLDEIKRKIDKESEAGNWQRIPDLIFQFVIACGYEVDDPPWMEMAELYRKAAEENLPRVSLPLFRSKEKGKKQPWDYEGRSWYFWVNLFASNYGWTADYIASLDVDDAVSLYQEILVDEQQKKEWEYSLSELAYPYNKTTKKSSFKPLGKPDWMALYDEVPNRPVQTVKIPVRAMPIGEIISLDGT